MEETKAKKPGGKREGQKYKSLLVWDILLKKTDENHALRLKDIEEHLSHYGITAERHSIKRDIDDILTLLNKEIDFDLDELEIEERDLLGYADGERHFVVNTGIAISDQFFGWLCGFRKMAKIVSPPDVVDDFQRFLDDIYGRYESE